MAQVKFKRGTQSSLNGHQTYEEGTFYLTNDTDRLYFAQTSNRLAELNQYIRTIPSTADLNNLSIVQDGDFYYAKNENVLCVRDSLEWIQINPDTNIRLLSSNNGLQSANSLDSNNQLKNEAKINLNISDDGDDPVLVTGSVTIKGGSNVQVSQENNTITIAAIGEGINNTKYSIDTATATVSGTGKSGAKIQLNSDDSSDDSEIIVRSENENLSVGFEKGVLILEAVDQSVQSVTAGFDNSGRFRVGVQDATNATAVSSSYITPTIKYGQVYDTINQVYNTSSIATFSDVTTAATPSLTLDVYTRAQVDNAINTALSAADAMTYLGVVTNSNATTNLTSNAPWGSVYKAGEDIIIENTNLPVVNADIIPTGALVIAEKAENYIGAELGNGSTQWKIIVTESDQVINFNPSVSSEILDNGVGTGVYQAGSIRISDGIHGAGFSLIDGTHTNVTFTKSGDTVTGIVSQAADYTAQNVVGSNTNVTQSEGTEATFTAITAIQTDAYGNVVDGSIQTKTFTVSGGPTIQSVTEGVTHTNSGATVTTSVKDTGSAVGKTASIAVISDNLTITNNSATGATATTDLKINLEWGSF